MAQKTTKATIVNNNDNCVGEFILELAVAINFIIDINKQQKNKKGAIVKTNFTKNTFTLLYCSLFQDIKPSYFNGHFCSFANNLNRAFSAETRASASIKALTESRSLVASNCFFSQNEVLGSCFIACSSSPIRMF